MGRVLRRVLYEHHGACVAGLAFLALLLRVGVFSDLKRSLYFSGLTPDEDTYHKWAARIADGTDISGFAPDFPRLPAEVFGALYSWLGPSTQHVRVLNLVLGTLVCVLVYAIARVAYGRAAGLIALALSAFSESLAFYSATVLHTCLGLALFGLLWLLVVSSLELPRQHVLLRFLGAGVLAGLLINVRGNAVVIGLLMIPIAVQAWRSQRAQAPWLAAQLLAALAAGYVLAANASGGLAGPRSAFNLYLGNNPDNPTPYFRPVRFTSSAPEYQTLGFVVEASRRAGLALSGDEAERFWIRAVLADAAARPGAALAQLARKSLAVVHASPSDNNHDLRLFRGFVPTLKAACLPTWLLLVLGVAGASVLPRDRRTLLGAAGFLAYAATIVVFFAGERLRVPLLLIANPLAAAGIVQIAEATSHVRRGLLARYAIVACSLGALAHAPLAGAGELSGPYNMHALLLLGHRDLDGSERWYRRALALDEQDSPAARIGLASILQLRGEPAEAIAVLEPLPDTHYEAASKQEWLGNLWLTQREPRQAADAYAKAIDFDASKQNAYKGLFIAHRMLGQDADAAQVDARLRRLQEQARQLQRE